VVSDVLPADRDYFLLDVRAQLLKVNQVEKLLLGLVDDMILLFLRPAVVDYELQIPP